MRIRSLIFVIVMSLFGTASGQTPEQMTLLGITVGASVESLPACYGGAVFQTFDRRPPSEVCVDRTSHFRGSDGTDTYTVLVPDALKPSFIKEGRVMAILSGKQMEYLMVLTDGVEVQEDAYAQLVEKYGQPARREVKTLQNGFGARFDVISATWRFERFVVSFDGATDSLAKGRIAVITNDWLASRARQRGDQPKL